MHKVIVVSLVVVASLFLNTARAQKGTSSPYSVFGLGEISNGQYAYFMGMGNALTANTDSTIVNQNNPASYSYISRFRPLFQIGVNGKFSTYTEEGQNPSSVSQFGLSQFQLGLPIAKRWGGAIGLTPFASTGYNVVNQNIVDGDTLSQNISEGAGTISKFHLGASYKYKFKNSSSISGGVNVNYIFGSTNKIESFEYAKFSDYALHSRVENETRINSLAYDLGIIYEKYLDYSSFSVGVKYSPAVNLTAYQDLLATSYSLSFYNNYSYPGSIIDTTEAITDNEGVIRMPKSYSVGVEYRLNGKGKEYLLKFSADVKHQKWSDYVEEFGDSKVENTFKDRTSTSFGLQYSPHVGRNANNNLISYVGRMHYRIGFSYTLSELLINNKQLADYGMSFGLGLPITTGNSNTSINLGVKYGSLGTTDLGLIKEDYLGVFFGITISPGMYDRWFLKRKYD